MGSLVELCVSVCVRLCVEEEGRGFKERVMQKRFPEEVIPYDMIDALFSLQSLTRSQIISNSSLKKSSKV